MAAWGVEVGEFDEGAEVGEGESVVHVPRLVLLFGCWLGLVEVPECDEGRDEVAGSRS